MRGLLLRLFLVVATVVTLGALPACGAAPPADPLEALRAAAGESADGEAVGRLLLGELLVPGGTAARATAVRGRLEGLGEEAKKGLFASLARAFDDEVHGRFRSAALAHLDVIAAARGSQHPDAHLVAWFSSNHLLGLRQGVADLWLHARDIVKKTIADPGNVGWRARGELVEWWTLDGAGEEPATATEGGVLEAVSKLYGCVEKARFAGPFGHLAAADHRVHYDAERAGPWPLVFPRDPLRQEAPRVRPAERAGCVLRAPGAAPGIYYIETFVDLPADREMIIAVQGTFAIFVDDTEVLTRDTRVWGIWPRFGAHVRLEAGRHRILARVAGPDASIRLQSPTGTPLGILGSDDPAPPYAILRPEVLPDPNALAPFQEVASPGFAPQPGVPRPRRARDPNDPIARALAAHIAHVEGQDDLGGVLVEPLVKDASKPITPDDGCGHRWSDRATGPALALAAGLLDKDPIFSQAQARDCVKEARTLAAERDPELWSPRFWLLLDEADKSGVAEVQPKLSALADHFAEVPEILRGLAAIYARIGWKAEHRRAVKLAAQRFPDDADALRDLLRLHDEDGDAAAADSVIARIKRLDPEAEVELERAIERRDFKAATAELTRLGSLRKDRRDIAARMADLLTRAGSTRESMAKLEAAVQKKPLDAEARLALADARLAHGDRTALARALVDAIHAGAETSGLREVIDLVEGMTELSPYRIDGGKVIADFEAAKVELAGTAARVLDYSAIWIHADGSARMLEHEILRILSAEGIRDQAEQRPRGMVLKIRTRKPDGRVLEPEIVAGKETITMPHLEIGDYVETETITTLRGDGQGGQRFEGPRWFFREEKIPYFRSEFITISPKNRPLDIETGGPVPKPEVTESGALVIRKWRVDRSPALREEPASAPIQEFLPNVRIGWGLHLADTVSRMIDAASEETPHDPRVVRAAVTIAGAGSVEERARRIYRWVLANIENGRETDARRIIMGKSGNRTEGFLYLCRLAGIEADIGLVRDRLAPEPTGPMSEVETYAAVAVRISTNVAGTGGPRWMVVRDKFAPYGYMPSSMRGQPAIVLREGAPRETTPVSGSADGVTHEGTVTLAADGSARLTIDQRYDGKLAIALRNALQELPEARFKEIIESRLVPQSLPGARVISVEIQKLLDLDEPLVLHMQLEMSSFARPRAGELVVAPLFPLRLSALASLESRETPIYISEEIATRLAVKLRIKLPDGARVTSELAKDDTTQGGRSVHVADHVEPGYLVLDRVMDLPAGRIQPAEYPEFQAFARHVDATLHRDVFIALPGH